MKFKAKLLLIILSLEVFFYLSDFRNLTKLTKIFKILIGISFSPNLKANVFEAVRIANSFDAKLIGVHVGDSSLEKKNKLNLLFEKIPKLNIPVEVIWEKGEPVKVILEICKRRGINLLILGALQRENFYNYYIGSIARKLTRRSPCSVLLLIKPSVEAVPYKNIVVDGLKDKRTEQRISYSFEVAKKLNCKRITIVDEITEQEIPVKVSDDKTLQEMTLAKQQLEKREDLRLKGILSEIDKGDIMVNIQSIFGRRGYSIGHYAKVKRADLLIIDAPVKTRFWDRLFVHDIEYILSDLPTDVLIVRENV